MRLFLDTGSIEEIRAFIALGRAQFIRLIVVDGEPHAADPQRECLPPSLSASGAPEPLAADGRPEADGKQGAKLKLLAGILGVPYDELRQREAARRQKRLAVVALAASVGFVVMAGLTVFAQALGDWPVPGGPSRTVGMYSSICSRPSKVRWSTRSRVRSGYPSKIRSRPVAPVMTGNTTTR